jgi:iron-sulfur cluster repair protein YtfE (RIC family)
VVDALLDCHERIRQMSGLARAIATAQGRPEGEIGEAAGRVRRYFTESLAHHVADEEESILPRLRGRDAAVDAALDSMEHEHRDHAQHVARLVAACAELEQRPGGLAELRAELDQVSARLVEDFEAHLAGEEKIVLPAIRRLLSEEERAQIRAEMRARRGPAR